MFQAFFPCSDVFVLNSMLLTHVYVAGVAAEAAVAVAAVAAVAVAAVPAAIV